jgi:hypothetical protein
MSATCDPTAAGASVRELSLKIWPAVSPMVDMVELVLGLWWSEPPN